MVNLRIAIWVFFVIISIILIAPNPSPEGVRVIGVDRNSELTGLQLGDTILKIEDQIVSDSVLQKEYFGTVKIETNKGVSFYRVNGSLGIDYEDVPNSNLNFGLDIKGGVRAIVLVDSADTDVLEDTVGTLQTRINVFGLRESTFRPIASAEGNFVEISIAGGNREELRQLLETVGRFEAKIPLTLDVRGGSAEISLENDYKISVNEDSVEIGGVTASVGERFDLEGIGFTVLGVSDNSLNLTSHVFTGEDIITVFLGPQHSGRSGPVEDGYSWSFAVELTVDGANQFASVTKNLDIIGTRLSSPINLFLDDELIDSLSVSSNLKGQVVREVSISGVSDNVDEAIKERSQLQSILRSGELPASIELVQMDSISPNLGLDFLRNAALAGLGAIIGVSIVAFIRYRKVKFVIPMVVVSLSEVLIILGAASVIGWTIDLAAIAGVIAAVGTGIDSQIIILDQSTKKENISMKEKLRRAFFIIFGAGGTSIAAMIPLTIIGFGLLRGFAIVTIIGVLVGILVTRPAFGVIIEKLSKESHEER